MYRNDIPAQLTNEIVKKRKTKQKFTSVLLLIMGCYLVNRSTCSSCFHFDFFPVLSNSYVILFSVARTFYLSAQDLSSRLLLSCQRLLFQLVPSCRRLLFEQYPLAENQFFNYKRLHLVRYHSKSESHKFFQNSKSGTKYLGNWVFQKFVWYLPNSGRILPVLMEKSKIEIAITGNWTQDLLIIVPMLY